jgi:hypothetical protein
LRHFSIYWEKVSSKLIEIFGKDVEFAGRKEHIRHSRIESKKAECHKKKSAVSSDICGSFPFGRIGRSDCKTFLIFHIGSVVFWRRNARGHYMLEVYTSKQATSAFSSFGRMTSATA